ncbi:MAG: hypothetical protein JW940_16745 [Polyangiaceae bacterium]|nr:hypothetical protein [Polyangiaceae bacterium]
MRARSFNAVGRMVVLGSMALCGCGASSSGDNGGSDSGGSAAGGAMPSAGTSTTSGGGAGSGGAITTGGLSNGGITSAGGSPTGGTTPTGGSHPITGGTTGLGGMAASGGSAAPGGAAPAGGATGLGGTAETGGAMGGGGRTGRGGTGRGGSGGAGETGGAPTGGTTSSGGAGTTGGTTGSGGGDLGERPCDIYAAANTPCVAAYSMVRALSNTYSGPLYQVRNGSSSQNTGTGGQLQDVGTTQDGYADVAPQDSFCSGTVCTVSLLYDQSGNGNHLPVAKKGRSDGGQYAAMDDFESSATQGQVTAGGHKVYSLYMDKRQGYRLATKGKNVPLGTAAQGIYELADGTHVGDQCCWDFGNVTTDPTQYGVMNTLFFGIAFWGAGAGDGPWFMADFEGGVWAGGSVKDDPGWGALNDDSPPNPKNPSLKVPLAFGILKTDPSKYTLRMANLQSAGDLTTAYEGVLPKAMNNLGGIVLGVGGDNSNNSWGTFYEGAITKGYPSNETDLAVMQNVKAVGYSK